jgi:putative ABC transport system permease protein
VQLPDFFLPQAAQSTSVLVRSSVSPLSLVGSIQHEVGTLDPDDVVYKVRTMDEMIAGSLAERRFSIALLSVFAGVALLLATIGIYGVVSYLVGQRTNEIGIRMALGAQQRDVLRMVLGQGGKMAAVGVTVGLVASFGLTRLMATMLFGVTPTDPFTFGGVAVILLAVVLLACWIPARRAMRVDPMVALRHE